MTGRAEICLVQEMCRRPLSDLVIPRRISPRVWPLFSDKVEISSVFLDTTYVIFLASCLVYLSLNVWFK